MSTPTSRIGILGGGFGGLYTALRLHQLDWPAGERPEIVLIDQRDRFVFLPLLYELITDELQTWEIAPPYEELLANTGIQFCQDTVTGIDPTEKMVHLANHPDLKCDRLVLALGGKTPLLDIPGLKENALTFGTLQDAYRLIACLRQLEQSDAEKIRIAIIGGGYSGVELACKLSDRLGERGRIRIVERGAKILQASPAFNQKAAMDALDSHQVWLDLNTTVTALTSDSITLSHKEQTDKIPVNLVLWTVGTQVSELIRDLPLPHSDRGQLQTSNTLQVLDHPDLFALGDIAICEAFPDIPSTGQVAIQQADYCAWNIWATLRDRPLLPFKYQPLGEMLSLGTDQAALAGMGMTLNGPLAHLARRFVYLYRLPTFEHQMAVGFNWLTRPFAQLLGEAMGK